MTDGVLFSPFDSFLDRARGVERSRFASTWRSPTALPCSRRRRLGLRSIGQIPQCSANLGLERPLAASPRGLAEGGWCERAAVQIHVVTSTRSGSKPGFGDAERQRCTSIVSLRLLVRACRPDVCVLYARPHPICKPSRRSHGHGQLIAELIGGSPCNMLAVFLFSDSAI